MVNRRQPYQFHPTIKCNEATNKRHLQGFFPARVSMSAQNWQWFFFILKFRRVFTFLCESFPHNIWFQFIRSMISIQKEFRKLIFQFDKKAHILKQFIEHTVHRNQMTWLLSIEFPNPKPSIFVAFRNTIFGQL